MWISRIYWCINLYVRWFSIPGVVWRINIWSGITACIPLYGLYGSLGVYWCPIRLSCSGYFCKLAADIELSFWRVIYITGRRKSNTYFYFLFRRHIWTFSLLSSPPSIGSCQRIGTIFQKLLYYRQHKLKDIISGYLWSGTSLRSNGYKHWFNQRNEWILFTTFSMRRGGLLMLVTHLQFSHYIPNLLLFTLIGYTNHKYASVYPYYLL